MTVCQKHRFDNPENAVFTAPMIDLAEVTQKKFVKTFSILLNIVGVYASSLRCSPIVVLDAVAILALFCCVLLSSVVFPHAENVFRDSPHRFRVFFDSFGGWPDAFFIRRAALQA